MPNPLLSDADYDLLDRLNDMQTSLEEILNMIAELRESIVEHIDINLILQEEEETE